MYLMIAARDAARMSGLGLTAWGRRALPLSLPLITLSSSFGGSCIPPGFFGP